MNCRSFQNQLREYVEGSLSGGAREGADVHLAGCDACRQAVEREQRIAQYLFNRIRQDTATLELGLEIRRRILASARVENPAKSAVIWHRFAWPLGIAAALILSASILLRNHPRVAPSAVSVEVSYRVPAVEFRRRGNLLIDTVSYRTVVASATLQSDARKPASSGAQTKAPL